MAFELRLTADTFSSPREEILSKILSPAQVSHVHNLIVERMKMKLHMPATTENFVQQQEYLRGQMDQLIELIQLSEIAQQDMTTD